MRPDQFLQRIRKSPPAGAYLFLGSELYQLDACRRALLERVLGSQDRENGLARFDLAETTLAVILDDARSLSLFAANRVIWVSGAEAALPRGRASSAEENASSAELADYLGHPTPGTVLVFESSRYDFEGEDRTKLERVQKLFGAIPDVVEFRPYTLEAARALAQDLAKEAGLEIGLSEIGLLVESLERMPDASRTRSRSCGCMRVREKKLPRTTSPGWCPAPRRPISSAWYRRSAGETASVRSTAWIRCCATANTCRWR